MREIMRASASKQPTEPKKTQKGRRAPKNVPATTVYSGPSWEGAADGMVGQDPDAEDGDRGVFAPQLQHLAWLLVCVGKRVTRRSGGHVTRSGGHVTGSDRTRTLRSAPGVVRWKVSASGCLCAIGSGGWDTGSGGHVPGSGSHVTGSGGHVTGSDQAATSQGQIRRSRHRVRSGGH
eukprot:884396-Rhodomonas_salina.1